MYNKQNIHSSIRIAGATIAVSSLIMSSAFSPMAFASPAENIQSLSEYQGTNQVSNGVSRELPTDRFTDVKGHWIYNSGILDVAVQQGLITGYTGTTLFGPDDNITRGQTAVIIHRYATQNNIGTSAITGANPFSDLEEGRYYTDSIKWCYENGVISGYGGTDLVGADDQITRAQLTTILNRFAHLCGSNTEGEDIVNLYDMNDWETIPQWASISCAWAHYQGIVTGVGDTGNFAPNEKATRAEATKMLATTFYTADRLNSMASVFRDAHSDSDALVTSDLESLIAKAYTMLTEIVASDDGANLAQGQKYAPVKDITNLQDYLTIAEEALKTATLQAQINSCYNQLLNGIEQVNKDVKVVETEVSAPSKTAWDFFNSVGASSASNILNTCKYSSYNQRDRHGDATNAENLYKVIDLYRQVNQRRTSVGLSELGVNYNAVAMAISNANWSALKVGHSGQFNIWENVAWGSMPTMVTRWFDNEKTEFDQAVASGKYPGIQNMSGYQISVSYPELYHQVGHYLNIIEPSLKSFGMGCANYQGGLYDVCVSLVMDTTTPNCSVDEFETQLKNYLGK